MSSWDVYWILMLDNISGAALFLWFICGLMGTAAFVISFDDSVKDATAIRIILFLVALFGWLCGLGHVLIPDTKQAAVIYIAPRVLTDENIDAASAETREVYGLFKSWLREQAGVEAESTE